MDVVFAYDARVAVDDAGYIYTGGAFSNEVFLKYLQFFDHVILLARQAESSVDLSKLNKIEDKRVSVVFVPNIRSAISDIINVRKRNEYKNIIKKYVNSNNAVIIRMPSKNGEVAAHYCLKNKKPILVEVVGCPWDSYRFHSLKGKVIAPIEWYLQRRIVKRANYVVYVTERFLQKRYPTSGISAGISDVELPQGFQSVIDSRLSKKHDVSNLKIGTIGNVEIPYKGQKYVVKAISLLKNTGRHYEYHLVGGGKKDQLLEYARKLGVENQVIFDGIIPHEEIFSWLDNMDVYIQPSIVEGLPRSVVEAMSRGLPIMGSKVGGIPELIHPSMLFNKKKTKEIALLLKTVTGDMLNNHSVINYRKAMDYSKEKLEKKRNDIYSSFLYSAQVHIVLKKGDSKKKQWNNKKTVF